VFLSSSPYQALLKQRSSSPAFHPDAPFRRIDVGSAQTLVIQRTSVDAHIVVTCITNLGAAASSVSVSSFEITSLVVDMLDAEAVATDAGAWTLAPYQTRWLSSVN
jgi:hypothetical protein